MNVTGPALHISSRFNAFIQPSFLSYVYIIHQCTFETRVMKPYLVCNHYLTLLHIQSHLRRSF